jgi:hypothetical protein
MRVHADSFFRPLAGQVHELHPSGAVQDRWGQHLSSARLLLSRARKFPGAAEHCQLASASTEMMLRSAANLLAILPASDRMSH